MIVENPDAFKSWLTSRLSRICDADPAALAKYVIALVKKDKTETELRAFCLDQLDVFLMKETKPFVDLLFDALKSKNYLQKSTSEVVPSNEKDGESLITTTSPAVNAGKKTASPISSEYKNENEYSKRTKSEEERSDIRTNSDNSAKGKSQMSSAVKVKSHVANVKNFTSPEHTQRSNQHRSRSQDREYLTLIRDSGKRERTMADEKDRNSTNFPSKKYKSRRRNHYYPPEDKFRDDRRYPRRSKERRDRDSNNKSRSRSSSWDRDRSRSRSTSRSSERSRSRSKEQISERDHGDTDYRQKQASGMPLAQIQPVNSYASKPKRERCADYDEKGFCMQGELCQFDHGTDPILVDDVSVLNFVDDPAGNAKSPKPPPPPPPSSPPPLPPLPPLPPPPGVYVPEPYNPEAPGMNLVPRLNFFVPPLPPHIPPPPPPPPHHMSLPPPPPPACGVPNTLYSVNEVHTPFHKTHRTRELIGVRTVENIDSSHVMMDKGREKDVYNTMKTIPENSMKSFSTDERNKVSHFSSDSELKRKRTFDYNRLGPSPRKLPKRVNNNRCTLECRKIPKHLNTISMLNGYFSKFGQIVNLQIGYDSDPEAALIQFMSPMEATAAYRCENAVFNNRFIKVFYHIKKKDTDNNDIGENTASTPFLPEKTTENKLNEPRNNSQHIQQKENSGAILSTVYTHINKGTVSRTVFIPSKKQKFPAIVPTPIPNRRIKEQERQKDTLVKRYELHKKQQELLKSQIDHQKIILDKLSKCKTEKERDFLKQTLQTMTEKITIMQNGLKKDAEELKQQMKNASTNPLVTKSEAAKQLLDAEMDLYNQQHSGDDSGTAELLMKVNELKQRAKALGLIDTPGLRQTKVLSRIAANAKVFKASPAHSVDHRPKKLFVTGFGDRESVVKHFLKFGNIEKLDDTSVGLIITYSTRMEAETAFLHGKTFDGVLLSVSWYIDSPLPVNQSLDSSMAELKNTPVVLEGDEEEEEEEDEEEDSEARSWRR